MSDNVFIDVVEPIDYHVLAPTEKELERWWARQNRQGRGAGAFDANSIGTSGSDSDASDCGGMTMREAQQLVNKRRAEYPGRLDERFASGMRVKTKLAPSSPLATIPSSPTIHRNRADSSSSGEGEGLAGPSPRSPLDRAAARDAHLEPDAATGGSPKAAPRPATIALLTPAVSSEPSSPSPRTRLRHHLPFPGVIDEVAPAAACAPPDDAASDRYVDIEAGVREIIAREETAATTTAGAGGWANTTRRIARRFADRRIPGAAWAALGVLWLYAIARLVLGA
mmetsp:Transcript_6336/g.25750  ORF Transcript_6336/g.25750 Transcript_6336/m.25750 type:complete len:282 (-) Transcript_6336:107-952(-)